MTAVKKGGNDFFKAGLTGLATASGPRPPANTLLVDILVWGQMLLLGARSWGLLAIPPLGLAASPLSGREGQWSWPSAVCPQSGQPLSEQESGQQRSRGLEEVT